MVIGINVDPPWTNLVICNLEPDVADLVETTRNVNARKWAITKTWSCEGPSIHQAEKGGGRPANAKPRPACIIIAVKTTKTNLPCIYYASLMDYNASSIKKNKITGKGEQSWYYIR